jgi:hypothetical protein
MDNALASGAADVSLLSVLTTRRRSQPAPNGPNLTAKRQRTARQGATHTWKQEKVVDLLQSLEVAKHAGRQSEIGTFTVLDYRAAAQALSEKYDVQMTEDKVKNKFNYLKSQ